MDRHFGFYTLFLLHTKRILKSGIVCVHLDGKDSVKIPFKHFSRSSLHPCALSFQIAKLGQHILREATTNYRLRKMMESLSLYVV